MIVTVPAYPRFMCRPGTTEDAWGYRIDPGSADSPESEAAMLKDGWHLLPGDWEKIEPATTEPERPRPSRQPKVRTKTNGTDLP